MPTLARATEILSGAGDVAGLTELAHTLGFTAAPLPLDEKARSTLGIPPAIEIASVARGHGALRALILQAGEGRDDRDILTALVDGLARQSAQLLWTVLVGGSENITILCWASRRPRPRIVSLVCKRNRLLASDAETLCSMAAARNELDVLTYARWLDILGRESITRNFFRTLEEIVTVMAGSFPGRIPLRERRELALTYLSRLIFLSFLEAKGWLDGDFGFLENSFGRCLERGGHFQMRVLEPLFFGTLNTPVRARAARAREFGRIPFLNGGLFARSPLEKRARRLAFSDDAFGTAFGSLLSRYRFSGREDSAAWSEASIDPEMLGKAFEALMATENRKGSGAFYTPQDLVEHVTEEALAAAASDNLSLASLSALRVLDPSCGSGAFLVYMLERLTTMRKKLGEHGSVAEIRRRVLGSSIFGVDLNPTAVWLCELRLWLSVVVETDERDPMRVVPLPNLDRHIRVGDSLSAGDFRSGLPAGGQKLQSLRSRYMRATGRRKDSLARELDRHERQAALHALSRRITRLHNERKELLLACRTRDLFGKRAVPTAAERSRLLDLRRQVKAAVSSGRALKGGGPLAFSFDVHFADAAAAGGFDIVVGNPPWVRLHRIPAASRESLRREFSVYRDAAWQRGAAMAGAGRGFAAQVDMAALFVERSHGLLKSGGTMALLLPSKLWRSLAGGGVRALLSARSELVLLEDHGDTKSGFDAAVYPSLMVSLTRQPFSAPSNATPQVVKPLRCEVRSHERVVRWESSPTILPFDDTRGSPWLLVPPEVRQAFDCVREAGVPLSDSPFGRPLLGVKTGYNEAYVVRVESVDGNIATVSTGDRRSTIELEMLRPAVRGETLSDCAPQREHIVWPHDRQGRPLERLPPLATRWLSHYRRELTRRTDLHSRKEWWSVFRVESASNDLPRVIWADIGRRPHAVVADARSDLIPLNTCYVVFCRSQRDARALAALVNGPLIAAWLDLIAEPARGDYRRYLGWTMSFLPIPSDWTRARAVLEAASTSASARIGDAELLEAGLDAYAIERRTIEPLLEWTRRYV